MGASATAPVAAPAPTPRERPLRVCHLNPFGFDTPYFEALSVGTARRGVVPLLVSLSAKAPPRWAASECARFVSLEAPRRIDYPRAVRLLARLLEAESIDVLQTHLFDAGVVGLLAARRVPRLRTLVTRHHLDDASLGGTRFHVALDRWMARAADRVVVSSEAVKRYMVAEEGASSENVDPIHYGFDFEKLEASEADRMRVRRDWGAERKIVFGCVGRFVPNKGHAFLFDALARLVAERSDLRVVLLGSGDEGALRASIERHGVEDRVLFGGYRHDIPACMRAFDVLVHPSLSESFGQVLVEAMAVGTPVVATEIGGVPEIIEHGRTGLLVPPRDPEALAAALRLVAGDRALRERLGEAGRSYVRRAFTIEKMVARQMACYERLIGR